MTNVIPKKKRHQTRFVGFSANEAELYTVREKARKTESTRSGERGEEGERRGYCSERACECSCHGRVMACVSVDSKLGLYWCA